MSWVRVPPEAAHRKSDCLGCAVLLCLVVCLTLLASFFLPSHLSLKHVILWQQKIWAPRKDMFKHTDLNAEEVEAIASQSPSNVTEFSLCLRRRVAGLGSVQFNELSLIVVRLKRRGEGGRGGVSE